MTYKETLDYLFSRLPMYQRKGKAAYKADIGNIVLATKHLGNPHNKFKSLHIAGTNGKGSTAHMLASILQESGYNVGLYTSPHLKDFRERIKINGEMISQNEVISFVQENKTLFENLELSFFEFSVAMAFNYFAKKKVDIAVIETGLGGRLDSTNIITPELSIITNIGLDHTNLLGNTIEKIAFEKAGIIKKNVPVIIGRKQKETSIIFKQVAQEKKASLIFSKIENKYQTDLKGNYQEENIAAVISSIKELQKKGWNISDENIKKGLLNTVKNTSLFGRWQTLSKDPLIICDTGHNEDGIKEITHQLTKLKYNQLHFVFGTVNDKNLDNILPLLPKDAKYYFCKANISRALSSKDLEHQAKKHKLEGDSFSNVNQALTQAKENYKPNDLIFVGGSTFVVAEVI